MTAITTTQSFRLLATACLIFAVNHGIPNVSARTNSPAVAAGPAFSYADYADLATASPVIAKAQITQAMPLSGGQAAGTPAGFKRQYVQAKVSGLIRGDGGISPVVSFLYDAPLDARGKIPKLRKREVLLFARRAGQPGQIQLVGLIDWSPTAEASVKAIASELLSNDAPPRIASVGDAFHVAGTIAGEGETQIFLKTETGDPVSLSIISRPGEQPHWAVALGEVVDEAAATPQPGTLLWYRLACGLPRDLPPVSVRTLAAVDADAARRDYSVVLAGLGACGRTRKAPGAGG
jgi:hypothetical protein